MLSAALKPLSMEAGDPAPTAADFARIPFLPIRADDDLYAEAYRACGTHTILQGHKLAKAPTGLCFTPPRIPKGMADVQRVVSSNHKPKILITRIGIVINTNAKIT